MGLCIFAFTFISSPSCLLFLYFLASNPYILFHFKWYLSLASWLQVFLSYNVMVSFSSMALCDNKPANLEENTNGIRLLLCPTAPVQFSRARPHSIKVFQTAFYPWWREKMYQVLSHFSVLQVTESWVGPGNEARWAIDWNVQFCTDHPLQKRMGILCL